MPQVIPILAAPALTVSEVLAGQNCQISIYQKDNNVFVDLNADGVDIFVGNLALNATPIDAGNSYDGFQGNLYFLDTQGLDDPDYTGFNTRWMLIYLTAAEAVIAATPQTPAVTANILNLALKLN